MRSREEDTFKLVDKGLDAAMKEGNKGTAFTGFTENEIIGCAGILPIWEGVGHAWVVMGKNYKKHRLWIHKNVQDTFLKIAVGKGMWRVQANVQADFFPALRWIEALGFHCESTMKRYGPDGKDHYMYVRFFE